MSILKRIISFIYSRGISENFEGENEMTGFMNIMAFIISFSFISFFFITYFLLNDIVYSFIAVIISIAYLGIILLNHFDKVHLARLYFSLIIPIWNPLAMILVGGYYGQSVAACIILIIIAINYTKKIKLRNFLLVYNVAIIVMATIYTNFNGPIFGIHDLLFDEIVSLVLSLAWIYAIFYIYENRNKKYISSLKKKNQQLKEKTLELERFTSITTHDLKSPLQNIRNFLKVMDSDIQKSDYSNLQNYLGYATSSAYRMRELIEGVLEVSTHSSNEQVVNCKEVDLNKILKQVMVTNEEELTSKKAIVTSDPLPVFRCNPADITIIFQNLILNGIKYNTSEKPKIVINFKQLQNHYLIQFTDNGIGIDEKYHQEVFEYFKRLHNHSAYPGTGLGLGLCKKIVERYNGKIEIDSVVGAYTSFKIILPINWEEINKEPEKEISDLKFISRKLGAT